MKESLTKLQKIGFSDYEAKVFMALYQGYAMSAAEVATEAKIPRPSVYSILKNFTKKGLCNEIDTPSRQLYEIIDTNFIQDKFEIDYKNEYTLKIKNVKDCFDTIKPFYRSKQPQKYKTDVELIRGYNFYREAKFLGLVKNANQGILVMNRFRGNVSTELNKEAIDFHRRGGYIKSIYENTTRFRIKVNNQWQNVTKEDLIRICEEFTKHGEQVKFLDEVPQIVAVFDEQVVYISLFDEHTPAVENSDVIIKNKRFAIFITSLFNIYWDKADTLKELKQTLNL